MTLVTKNTKTILFTSLIAAFVIPLVGINNAYADHDDNTSTWQTDMTFDIHSTLNHVSHASFTPATDFEDAANVWNNVSGNWWDFTRDDSNGDIDIKSKSFSWFSSDLAVTTAIPSDGTMTYAKVEFNSNKDFRDVEISQGWWSYDFETVAIHEIGHVAGIHDHTTTSSSPMQEYIATNTVDRTLNSHDKATIRGMY